MITSPILACIALIYTQLAHDTFSQDWQDLLTWSGDGALIPTGEGGSISSSEIFTAISALTFLVIGLANQIAMFFFWKPSRHVFAILCLLSFLGTLSLGLLVSPPIENFLMELSIFISGITLALCYFSDPVVNRFLSTSKTEQGSALQSTTRSESKSK